MMGTELLCRVQKPRHFKHFLKIKIETIVSEFIGITIV